MPPDESGLEPELRDVPVADGSTVVAPPFEFPVWLGKSLMTVAEVGELAPVVVAATCQMLLHTPKFISSHLAQLWEHQRPQSHNMHHKCSTRY
jgi:hypothetical protein